MPALVGNFQRISIAVRNRNYYDFHFLETTSAYFDAPSRHGLHLSASNVPAHPDHKAFVTRQFLAPDAIGEWVYENTAAYFPFMYDSVGPFDDTAIGVSWRNGDW